ncbi:hypothetical protein ANRL1_00262 [Anaerolineae bacterium]|nr:hypothetical protein ANRL1_00262 [Anaerolineae bacterium]
MKNPEPETIELRFRARPIESLSLQIPADTLASIKRVAASRDMSEQALIKFYVGQGLRQDLAKMFAERVLETTSQVLARHIQSSEEVSAILHEIQVETTG